MALLSVVSASAWAEAAGEWPCFHGPRRDNKSAETGLLKKWPDGGPKLIWSAKGLGRGYSTVSIAGGTIYTAGMIEKETYVLALDLRGKPLWRKPNGRSWQSAMRHAIAYAGARATPTVDDGRVYHLAERGRLAAFDAKTGREIWALDLFAKFGGTTPKYGLAESVLIVGDKLICSPAGKKGYMVCLEKKTGKLVWANAEVKGTAGYCSAVLAPFGGFRQLISMSAAEVFGVDLATGKLLWRMPHANYRGNNVTDPVFHDGYVYASSPYGQGSLLVRLKPRGGGLAAEKAWANKLMDNHHGGVVLVDGYLYGAGHRARGWFCLEFLTGKAAWNARSLDGDLRRTGKGSLTFAEGMLYCVDERGTAALVRAAPKGPQVVSTFALPSGGRGPYWAHPVVCGKRLYIRHDDTLFAYDIAAK